MKAYETRTLSIIVLPEGESIFSEWATTIYIEDDAEGEFVTVKQSGLVDAGKIRIDSTEWPAFRAAIDRMIQECRPLQASI